MNAAQIIVNILLILSSIVMIVTVMLQSSDSDGMAGLTGSSSETFFGKNKGKSIEAKMKKWTWICLIVLAVLAIVYYVLQIPTIWGA